MCVCILYMYIIYNIYSIEIIALTLVLSFHPDSICQGAPPKSHASFVTGPETSVATMGQPVTPRSWKPQLTMSLITITSFFQQKKISQIILSCTFLSVNPRVWSLGSAPYDGYFNFLFTHLFLPNSHRFPPRFRPSEADEYHAWSSTRHSIWYLKLWMFTMASFEKGCKSMKLMYRPMDTQTWQDVSKKWLWWVVNKDGARMLGRCGPGICIDQGTVPPLLHEAVHVYNTTCHFTSKMVHSQS